MGYYVSARMACATGKKLFEAEDERVLSLSFYTRTPGVPTLIGCAVFSSFTLPVASAQPVCYVASSSKLTIIINNNILEL